MNKYLFLLTLFPVIARGQDTAVSCATNQKCAHILATFSLGAINAYRDNYSLPQGFEKNNVSGFLPLYAKLEYGITHHTGLAATFGYDAFIINYNQLYQGHDGMVKRYRSNAVTTLSAGASLFYHVVPFERIKRVDPFVGLGFSLNNVRQSAHPQGDSIVAIRENLISPYIKAGVRYYLSYNFSLFADAGYDKRSIVTLGASVRMGKPPRNMPADSDNDGIPDRVDSCRYASGPAAMNGCPDSDGDGIADSDDRCPLAAGPAYAHGCPDTDNDGVPDEYDNCPTFAGRLRGCPDSDGDGIADADDKCPNQVGYPEYNGCPDTDNDGTPDNDDACPLLAGPVYKHGCPDTVVKKDLTLEKDRITFIRPSLL
jgi:hypothetical protein